MTATQHRGGNEGSPNPSTVTVAVAYVAVFVALIVAWLIYTRTDPKTIVIDAEGFSVFAPLYIVAQAIERLLEPPAARVDATTAKKAALRRARDETARRVKANEAVDEALAEQAEIALARAKAERTIGCGRYDPAAAVKIVEAVRLAETERHADEPRVVDQRT